MKRRVVGYIGLGFGAYLVALLATVPARHALGWGLPQLAAHGTHATVAAVSGTLWSGSAEGVSIGSLPAMRVDWRLSPWSLLTGKLAADWRADSSDAHLAGSLTAGLGGTATLTDTDGRIPFSLIAPYLSVPLSLDGTLALNLQRLTLTDGRPSAAEGVVVWSQARVTAPQEVPLGDLKLNLTPDKDGRLVGHVADNGGPLDASGEITLDAKGAYRVNLLLAGRPGAAPALTQSLPLIGRKAPNGKFLLTFTGRL